MLPVTRMPGSGTSTVVKWCIPPAAPDVVGGVSQDGVDGRIREKTRSTSDTWHCYITFSQQKRFRDDKH